MIRIIDFHTHVYPSLPTPRRIALVRRQLAEMLRPTRAPLHELVTRLADVPEGARRWIEEFGALGVTSSLLMESSEEDLYDNLDRCGIDAAVIVAHPPIPSNESTLEIAARSSGRLIAAVNPLGDSAGAADRLDGLVARGARLLKLHPLADRRSPDDAVYDELLQRAETHALTVIVHTGAIHSRLFFKDPAYGDVERMEKWFERHPDVRFVLAHLNFHDPDAALALLRRFPNTWATLSWQPTEVIQRALESVGPQRLLFASDWPLIGNNAEIQLGRVREAAALAGLSREELSWVLGANAEGLLGQRSL